VTDFLGAVAAVEPMVDSSVLDPLSIEGRAALVSVGRHAECSTRAVSPEGRGQQGWEVVKRRKGIEAAGDASGKGTRWGVMPSISQKTRHGSRGSAVPETQGEGGSGGYVYGQYVQGVLAVLLLLLGMGLSGDKSIWADWRVWVPASRPSLVTVSVAGSTGDSEREKAE
jgi:hypothetical protein